MSNFEVNSFAVGDSKKGSKKGSEDYSEKGSEIGSEISFGRVMKNIFAMVNMV